MSLRQEACAPGRTVDNRGLAGLPSLGGLPTAGVPLRELVRTNDAVVLSFIEALFKERDIAHMILDLNMSVLEGSLGILPRRVLVEDERYDEARRLLDDAGLDKELRPR